MRDHGYGSSHLVYSVGLDKVHEPVISSHFMHQLCMNPRLELYDHQQFSQKSLHIPAAEVRSTLLPAMLNSCREFSRKRAAAAARRAQENYARFGLNQPRQVGLAEHIAEVMFDPHYRRGSRETCSRELIRDRVQRLLANDAPIEMVIPALPFKFSSPLKTRGALPDLAEVNFMLGLYEIVATIELIYRQARPHLRGRLARFTVVSDGSRFNNIVAEPDDRVNQYQAHLRRWIAQLGLQEHIELLDYSLLLRERLPPADRKSKAAIRDRSRVEYATVLWPIFNPCDMAATFRAAAAVDPDPESSNSEGRFFSLLKSLIYTMNYRTLQAFVELPDRQYPALYRELSSHIFEPYAPLDASMLSAVQVRDRDNTTFVCSPQTKEQLRQSVLREAWSAAIEYMAEIKSDRELADDPILNCLPDHFRWTIHPKSGQLAISTSTALGTPVQAWAGAAVFKRTRNGGIRLATLPVLALEGVGAVPIRVSSDDELELAQQPLFYVYPDVQFADVGDLLERICRDLVRDRVS
jgi:hypothetical protein